MRDSGQYTGSGYCDINNEAHASSDDHTVEVTAIPTRRMWDTLLMRVLFLEACLAFLGRYAHFGRELCTSGKWILDSNCIVATFCGLRSGSPTSVVYSHN